MRMNFGAHGTLAVWMLCLSIVLAHRKIRSIPSPNEGAGTSEWRLSPERNLAMQQAINIPTASRAAILVSKGAQVADADDGITLSAISGEVRDAPYLDHDHLPSMYHKMIGLRNDKLVQGSVQNIPKGDDGDVNAFIKNVKKKSSIIAGAFKKKYAASKSERKRIMAEKRDEEEWKKLTHSAPTSSPTPRIEFLLPKPKQLGVMVAFDTRIATDLAAQNVEYKAIAYPGGIVGTTKMLPIVLTNLINGVTYSVQAYRRVGNGPFVASAETALGTPVDVPRPPILVSAGIHNNKGPSIELIIKKPPAYFQDPNYQRGDGGSKILFFEACAAMMDQIDCKDKKWDKKRWSPGRGDSYQPGDVVCYEQKLHVLENTTSLMAYNQSKVVGDYQFVEVEKKVCEIVQIDGPVPKRMSLSVHGLVPDVAYAAYASATNKAGKGEISRKIVLKTASPLPKVEEQRPCKFNQVPMNDGTVRLPGLMEARHGSRILYTSCDLRSILKQGDVVKCGDQEIIIEGAQDIHRFVGRDAWCERDSMTVTCMKLGPDMRSKVGDEWIPLSGMYAVMTNKKVVSSDMLFLNSKGVGRVPNHDIHNTECIKIGCHTYTVASGGSPVPPGTILRPCPNPNRPLSEDGPRPGTLNQSFEADGLSNATGDEDLVREIEEGLEYTAEDLPIDQPNRTVVEKTEIKVTPSKKEEPALLPGYMIWLDRGYIGASNAMMTAYRLKPFPQKVEEEKQEQPQSGCTLIATPGSKSGLASCPCSAGALVEIYVGTPSSEDTNLPCGTTKDTIKKIFESFGTVESVNMQTYGSRGDGTCSSDGPLSIKSVNETKKLKVNEEMEQLGCAEEEKVNPTGVRKKCVETTCYILDYNNGQIFNLDYTPQGEPMIDQEPLPLAAMNNSAPIKFPGWFKCMEEEGKMVSKCLDERKVQKGEGAAKCLDIPNDTDKAACLEKNLGGAIAPNFASLPAYVQSIIPDGDPMAKPPLKSTLMGLTGGKDDSDAANKALDSIPTPETEMKPGATLEAIKVYKAAAKQAGAPPLSPVMEAEMASTVAQIPQTAKAFASQFLLDDPVAAVQVASLGATLSVYGQYSTPQVHTKYDYYGPEGWATKKEHDVTEYDSSGENKGYYPSLQVGDKMKAASHRPSPDAPRNEEELRKAKEKETQDRNSKDKDEMQRKNKEKKKEKSDLIAAHQKKGMKIAEKHDKDAQAGGSKGKGCSFPFICPPAPDIIEPPIPSFKAVRENLVRRLRSNREAFNFLQVQRSDDDDEVNTEEEADDGVEKKLTLEELQTKKKQALKNASEAKAREEEEEEKAENATEIFERIEEKINHETELLGNLTKQRPLLQCLKSSILSFGPKVIKNRSDVVVVNTDEIPGGCSVEKKTKSYDDGDWAAHFNMNKKGYDKDMLFELVYDVNETNCIRDAVVNFGFKFISKKSTLDVGLMDERPRGCFVEINNSNSGVHFNTNPGAESKNMWNFTLVRPITPRRKRPDASNCLVESIRMYGPRVNKSRASLVQGHWKHVPYGCSVQSGGDWAAHYNFDPEGLDRRNAYTEVLAVRKEECLREAVSQFGLDVIKVQHRLVEGHWRTIPHGCTIQKIGDFGARYNDDKLGQNEFRFSSTDALRNLIRFKAQSAKSSSKGKKGEKYGRVIGYSWPQYVLPIIQRFEDLEENISMVRESIRKMRQIFNREKTQANKAAEKATAAEEAAKAAEAAAKKAGMVPDNMVENEGFGKHSLVGRMNCTPSAYAIVKMSDPHSAIAAIDALNRKSSPLLKNEQLDVHFSTPSEQVMCKRTCLNAPNIRQNAAKARTAAVNAKQSHYEMNLKMQAILMANRTYNFWTASSYTKMVADTNRTLRSLKIEAWRTWQIWKSAKESLKTIAMCPNINCMKTFYPIKKCDTVKIGDDAETNYKVISFNKETHEVIFDKPLLDTIGTSLEKPIYLSNFKDKNLIHLAEEKANCHTMDCIVKVEEQELERRYAEGGERMLGLTVGFHNGAEEPDMCTEALKEASKEEEDTSESFLGMLGEEDPAEDTFLCTASTAYAVQVYCKKAASIRSMYANIGGGGMVVGGIYLDQNMKPGDRVGATKPVLVGKEWTKLNFETNIELEPGNYWLAVTLRDNGKCFGTPLMSHKSLEGYQDFPAAPLQQFQVTKAASHRVHMYARYTVDMSRQVQFDMQQEADEEEAASNMDSAVAKMRVSPENKAHDTDGEEEDGDEDEDDDEGNEDNVPPIRASGDPNDPTWSLGTSDKPRLPYAIGPLAGQPDLSRGFGPLKPEDEEEDKAEQASVLKLTTLKEIRL